ncbi:SDR family NAD(P)-dependent oxidoreductase [Novosphingobium sp.]|uniref:SDR family NAD(P)-dependent oxidoreductase n=1 Tax=Novosphingobium sp. TaxID=1874826 RepID=UPI001DF04E2B|nr:SDR family NAD(P)-dependent oxidoreductase [Novosphingobium sp.]MBX9662712.1 SDR family NAD(P)-dependent oxidoreductase [Novosphingobium sp.]
MRSFHEKRVFVTGGASGIGLGIVKALAKRGAFVVIADLRPDHIDRALVEIREAGFASSVAALTLDVTDRAAFAAVAERMDIELGGIDILVNNAGVGVEGPVLEAGYSDWDYGLGVNLGGVINGLQSFLPRMIAHGRGGHVVNVSSLAAAVRMPANFAIYAAGKAAVLNLSENMREELAGNGIGMSVLCPAFVRSNIHEAALNRPAHLREGSGFRQSEATLLERPPGNDWMDPETVGEIVTEGILANRLYIVTHGEFREKMRERNDALMDAVPEAAFQY